MDFQLEPVDILLQECTGRDPFSIVKRWALDSPYDHCFLYLGRVNFPGGHARGVPMIFESAGRGVILQSAARRYGQRVLVMRLNWGGYTAWHPAWPVIREALSLASDPQAYYDYLCIISWILPRLFLEKLSLPMPVAWHRNPWQLCSEALYEVFYKAGLVSILPLGRVPLPGDFMESPLLYPVWEGIFSEVI